MGSLNIEITENFYPSALEELHWQLVLLMGFWQGAAWRRVFYLNATGALKPTAPCPVSL